MKEHETILIKTQRATQSVPNKGAGGRALTQSETLTERVVLMVSWNDIFTFVIILMAILTYIDNHRHKK